MLPPINLAEASDAKNGGGGFFSRSRVNGRRASSSGRVGGSWSPLTRQPTAASSTPAADESSALDELSLIPREFFVVETNAVLPSTQFPPSQYESRYSAARSLWETVVFPALAPQTRQQVLLLRQTLEKLRESLPRSPEQASHHDARLQVLAYTTEELRVYSLCFHELIRQIKCICKEQSELLCEIRAHYDAALARMVTQVRQLNALVDKQQEQIGDLVLQHDTALRANDSLVEKALRSQPPDRDHAALRRVPARRQRRCRCQREESSSDDGDASDGSDGDDDGDAEEQQWRRERRNCLQLDQLHRARRRDSVVEENVAAARLQNAYHKYHVRKEQHRLALREEKHIAALDIQRSYRGFRQAQLALHRRAVVQVILRRRKEAAAVELLQANVRAYLLKQKREEAKESKRAMPVAKATTESSAVVAGDSSSPHGAVVDAAASEEFEGDQEPGAYVVLARDGRDRSASLVGFLNKLGDLTRSISTLQARVDAKGGERTRGAAGDAGGDRTVAVQHEREVPSHPLENDEKLSSDGVGSHAAEQEQLKDKIEEAEALMGLFQEAVRSLWASPSTSASPPEPHRGLLTGEQRMSDTSDRGDGSAAPAAQTLSQATSTSSLDLCVLPFDVSADSLDQTSSEGKGNGRRSTAVVPTLTSPTASSTGSRRLSSITTPPTTTAAHRRPTDAHANAEHSGDFHLDESLWNPELSAIRLDESRAARARNAELLRELLATREMRKKLVGLKQLMSDTYDTIVGRLREVPGRSLQRFITTRCALAMSLDEWRQHDAGALLRLGRGADPALSSLSFNLADILWEHFQCQSGLKHLVQSAVDNVASCVATFRAADPDVERFGAFLSMERSHDELLFFCVCRHLAAQGDSAETAAAHHSSRRQPAFHPDTMRETIDLPQALRVARTLFRVDDGESIREADAALVEVENAVYKLFQPSAAFGQFEAVLSMYFVETSSGAGPTKSLNQSVDAASSELHSDTATRPRLDAITRPTNVNQFHSKQFNAVASRSPLVRQRHQAATSRTKTGPCGSGIPNAGAGAAGERLYVHFDDLVTLLLKYRSEMNYFHLFTRWTRELFSSAAREATATSRAAGEVAAPRLLSDALFVETLAPYSLGPSERELTNIFHNALKQRSLQQWMPPRVFTSVVLLMLRNGNLGRTWRSYESAFEKAVEAIYETPDGDVAAATRLLELRSELFQLLIASAGAENLTRAEEIVVQIAKAVTAPVTQSGDQIWYGWEWDSSVGNSSWS